MSNSIQRKRLPFGLCVLTAAFATLAVQAEELDYDFRGKPFDSKDFRATGSNHKKVVKGEPKGLRIRLPADHINTQPVGLVAIVGVRGDFEITMDFELLQVEKPTKGQGAGVSIYITMVTETNEAATINRLMRPNGDQIVNAHRATTPVGEKREHSSENAVTEAQSGKLRLVRTGKMLSYQFAPGDSNDFHEFRESELGVADLDMVRFAADNGGSPTVVDVRIKSINIKANDLGLARPLPRKARWPWWVGGGLAIVLLIAGLYRYQSRRAAAAAS